MSLLYVYRGAFKRSFQYRQSITPCDKKVFCARISVMTILQDKILGPGGALDELAALDADIAAAITQYGPPPDRSLPANFDTLARSVIGQQISRSAASAIWQRMQDQKLSTANTIASMSPAALMPVGLSQRKAEYLIGIANEVTSGQLDFVALQHLPGDAVQARLIKIRGIGAWTADNFRLFALGDMDAWPVNDLALQEGMKRLKNLQERPTGKQMEQLGARWQPYRGAGALVLWHIYGILVKRATIGDI
jgi:DNA-3-methyladenine glycosylase II